MLIDRRAVREFLGRELDSCLWMKGLRRETILRELKQLRVPPVFKTDPWLHQLVCVWIGLCYPRYLFLLDMGLGKSKIYSDLITHTQREKKLEGALVVVPRKINVDSWVDDLAKHSDLEPWRIDCKDIEEKRERLLYPRGDVTIIDMQSLHWALCDKKKMEPRAGIGQQRKKAEKELRINKKALERVCRIYNWLGLDETHLIASNWNSLWFDILDRVSERMEFSYGATGTVMGRDPHPMWGQFEIIDRGETFGENLGLFRASFFTTKMNPWKGVQYVYDERMDADLHKMMQHRSIRYREEEVPELELPKRVHRERKLEMTPEQRDHYMKALEGLINADGKLADIDSAWVRMRQIASGYLVWKDEHGEHVKRFAENPKLEDLESVIDNVGDSKLVVAYVYTETGRLICERLKELKIGHEWLWGGMKSTPSEVRQRFMKDSKCRVLVMNDAAGGTGNDGLQEVARCLYFFETPSNPSTRQQVYKRVHRPGQKKRTFIYDAVMKRSVDRGILDGIAEGVDIFDRVVNGRTRYKNLFLG